MFSTAVTSNTAEQTTAEMADARLRIKVNDVEYWLLATSNSVMIGD